MVVQHTAPARTPTAFRRRHLQPLTAMSMTPAGRVGTQGTVVLCLAAPGTTRCPALSWCQATCSLAHLLTYHHERCHHTTTHAAFL